MKPHYDGPDSTVRKLINGAEKIRFIDDRLDELDPKRRAKVEGVMFRYGRNEWWRSTDPQRVTRYQIEESETPMFPEIDGKEDCTLLARGLAAIFGKHEVYKLPDVPGMILVELHEGDLRSATRHRLADEARKLLGTSESKETISESLLRYGFAEKYLPAVMGAMDEMKANNVAITTKTSLSEVVFDFMATMKEGKANARYHVFAKIAPSCVLEQEIAYLERANKHAVLRPVSSQVVEYIKNGNEGLLITLDVNENHRKLNPKDYEAYYTLREQALKSYASSSGMSFNDVFADPVIENFFNAALHTVYMNIDPDKSQFEKVVLSAVPPADVVDRWLSSDRANKDAVRQLKPLLPAYHAIVPELLEQSQSGKRIIVDTDRNRRNIIRDRYSGINVWIDPGFSGLHRVEFMIASIGHPDANFAANTFNYFARYVADEGKIDFSAFADAKLVEMITAGKNYRMGASIASRGENSPYVQGYITRAQQGLGRYL